MNMSATIPTARKAHNSPARYRIIYGYLTHVWRGYDMVTGDRIFSFVAQKNNDGDFVKHHSVVWHASS